jgi:hypothetical protein
MLVTTLAHAHGIGSLAEEMNEDGLAEYGVASSVIHQEAARLNLPHCFCEPSLRERAALNVQQENDLRATGFVTGWSEEEIQRRLLDEFRKRESVWCERLLRLDKWPSLLVCGANHVKTFPGLLTAHGLLVHVLESCWEPP